MPRAERRSQVPFEVAATCKVCGGDGVEPGTQPLTCPRCEGSGRLHQVSRSVFGEFVRAQTCPECRGRGQIIEHPCKECRGAGRVSESRTLDVDVPAGIHDGQRIRVSGEGHAGALGGRAGRRLRPRARQARSALRARGQRHLLAGRPDDRPGGARGDGDRRDARGRNRARASPPACSPARCASCAARACPCCRASGTATTACSSTSPCRVASPTSSAACSRSSTRRATSTPTATTKASSSKLKSAFR